MAKWGIKSKNNYAANDIIKCQMSCLKNSCRGARLAQPHKLPQNPPELNGRKKKKKQQETTKCKAASNLFKAIFQFIEVESIRNKKPPKRTEKSSDFSRGQNARRYAEALSAT